MCVNVTILLIFTLKIGRIANVCIFHKKTILNKKNKIIKNGELPVLCNLQDCVYLQEDIDKLQKMIQKVASSLQYD